MHDAPSADELLNATISFLTDVAAPQLTGQAAFHARVAANALALVGREMALRPQADARERSAYAALINDQDGELEVLRAEICAQIRAGTLTHTRQDVLAALRDVTLAQLAIDQPSYSGMTP